MLIAPLNDTYNLPCSKQGRVEEPLDSESEQASDAGIQCQQAAVPYSQQSSAEGPTVASPVHDAPASLNSKQDPVDKESDAKQQEPCPICDCGEEDDEDEDDEPRAVLECGHNTFHCLCLEAWARKCRDKGLELTCPMCRALITHELI